MYIINSHMFSKNPNWYDRINGKLVTFHLWGAAGSGGSSGRGGGGGYATGQLYIKSGTSLEIIVGQGGVFANSSGTAGAFGGGGPINAGTPNQIQYGGSGGGRTGILINSIEYITAGAGGGGNPGGDGVVEIGGTGGGLTGGTGTRGGTQTAGGTGQPSNTTTNGKKFLGGTGYLGGYNNNSRGASGGGGYWGGAGTAADYAAAGGGSSHGDNLVENFSTISGSTFNAPNTGHIYYSSGVAVGGNLNGAGGPGKAVIVVNGQAYTFNYTGARQVFAIPA